MPSHSLSVPPSDVDLNFTIEEIRGQLYALGITDLSEVQLEQLKCQLDGVIRRERANLSAYTKTRQLANVDDDTPSTPSPLSDNSSTPRMASPKMVSPVVVQDDLEVTDMWREHILLKARCVESPGSGSLNSNVGKSMVSSGHLLTVPKCFTSRRLPRHVDDSVLQTKSYAAPNSDRQTTEAPVHTRSDSPSDVPAESNARVPPRIELSIRTPSDTTESGNLQVHQDQTSPLPAILLPKSKSIPLPTLERRLACVITDIGDFESSQSVAPDIKSLESKPTASNARMESRVVHHARQAARMSSTSSSQPSSNVTHATHSWDSTRSVSDRSHVPPFSCASDEAAAVHQLQKLRSMASQQATVYAPRSRSGSSRATRTALRGSTLGQTRNLKVVVHDRSRTLSSSTQSSLPATSPNLESVEQIPPRHSGIKSQVDRVDFKRESRKFHKTNPQLGAVTEPISSDPHSELPGPPRHRFISPSGRSTRGDWTGRSAQKDSLYQSSSTTSTVTNVSGTRGGVKTESIADRSGLRSARFPENPVARVHNLQSRPHTASSFRSRAESQTSRSLHSYRATVSSASQLRRQDPVSRYHSYQRSWLANVVPGEDARRVLRWNVKTAMMHREVPVLQRNLTEVTRLFGPSAAAMLVRERQRKLKELNLGYVPPTDRHHVDARCRIRAALSQSLTSSASVRTLLSGN